MTLSFIVVSFNMSRELPRTLQSLTRGYQRLGDETDYEVLVIDNGSLEPLPAPFIESFGPEFQSHQLQDPPASPAFALNYGASVARGDILGLLVDGAHLLTPGVSRKALACFRAERGAVVATRYFYLGPGQQNETILQGYDQAEEDRLLASIQWPEKGYRLFEVGTPLIYRDFPVYTWFYKPLESNCLFLRKKQFEAMGGADERFDLPGGGFMNIDLFKRSCEYAEAQPFMLIGEGSFHQVHGGTTTNVDPEEQARRVLTYRRQYRELHGVELSSIGKDLFYYGDIPTAAANIQRLNGKPGLS